jgi:hypothetical protein
MRAFQAASSNFRSTSVPKFWPTGTSVSIVLFLPIDRAVVYMVSIYSILTRLLFTVRKLDFDALKTYELSKIRKMEELKLHIFIIATKY